MELRDSLVPFEPKSSNKLAGGTPIGTLSRVDVLTDDQELML